MKLREANEKLKNKILEFDIRDCPIRYIQAGDGWMKIAFKKGQGKSFKLDQKSLQDFNFAERRATFAPRQEDADEVKAASGARRDVAIVRRSDEDEAKLLAGMSEKLSRVFDQVRAFAEMPRAKAPIDDPYGTGIDIYALTEPAYPENAAGYVKTKRGAFYTYGDFDLKSRREKWMPAMDPACMASRMMNKKTLGESEGAESLDDPDAPLPAFE